MSAEGLDGNENSVISQTIEEWLEARIIPLADLETADIEPFVPHDQAKEGQHEKPMSPWATETGDIGDIPALKFEGLHDPQGDIIALKLDHEISVILPQVPPNRWVYLMVQRSQCYQNIPVINDKKYREEEEENLAKYPFRVLKPEGQVFYKEVNIDGTIHLAAKVFVHQSNKINMLFTRIGLDRIGNERTEIKRPSQGKEWMLKVLDSNNLAVLAEKKIQVFVEIRKPGKKRLQNGQGSSSENLPKKIKQEVSEVVETEVRQETENGPTMMVFYGQNKNKMISHLGQAILTDITDPASLPNILSLNRSLFKELAIQKIRNHFGNEVAEADLGDFCMTFSIKTLSDYGRQVYNQTVWEGGPVEAVLYPECVEPQLGPDGRPYHIVDCRIDLGALDGQRAN